MVAADRLGNAAKRLENTTPGPWRGWRTRSRHGRAIRFIETYCRPPKGKGHGKPMRLARFQKEWLEDVLADGVDVGVQSIPRGNGKSTFRAALALWAVFDGDDTGAPQVPIVATTVGQAMKSIYTPALQMVRADAELAGRSIPYSAWGSTRLWVPSTDGEVFPIANDVSGLQGLDPSMAIVDELAFMPIESWVALTESTGKRDRSLIVGISTPGVNRDNALWQIRKQVESGVDLPGFRYSEYAAADGCDLKDEREWRAANPAIGAGFLRIEALRSSAARTPEGLFRVFRLGQWVDGVDSWLGKDGGAVWDGLEDRWEMELLAPAWVGVDIGIYRDSTAVVVGQRRPDGRLHAKARVWLPTKDEPVDVTSVMAHIRDLDRMYRLQAVTYDPRYFDVPAKILEDEGVPMVLINQHIDTMTPVVGGCYQLLKSGGLSHDGDPVFTAQVLNAVTRLNERGFTLSKRKSRGRIDAAVALCLMTHQALSFEERPAQAVVW